MLFLMKNLFVFSCVASQRFFGRFVTELRILCFNDIANNSLYDVVVFQMLILYILSCIFSLDFFSVRD